MRRAWMLVPLVVGCGGVEQEEFASAYVDHYCEAWLTCGEQATNIFDGVDTLEDCRALEGPEIVAGWEGCTYKKARAQDCLEQMPAPSCPENGDLALIFPPICAEVWVKCVGVAEPEAENMGG
jgi:hypothetical protein